MSLAFVFPGQGSQKVGMGAQLKDERPQLFERYLSLADEVSGLPVTRLCLEGPIEELTRTDVAQPALFALGLAVADAAHELGLRPDYVAGHSLGEYTAAVVAGALSAQDGMRVVCERGRLMAAIQSEHPGAMAAVMGLPREEVEPLCEQAAAEGKVAIANINSPLQMVFSGEENGVARLMELAKEAGAKRVVRLQVGAAFHSELMAPVYEQLSHTMDGVSFTDPRTPLVAIFSARVLRTAEELREALLEQIVSPVRWVEVVQVLVDDGCDAFLELGPGKVLSGLIRRMHPQATVAMSESAQELQEFLATRS